MKLRIPVSANSKVRPLSSMSLLLGALLVVQGCGTTEKEPEPVVNVQVTPVKHGSIAQTISADAVVYPLEQAVITPKITSTIHKFHVQRGTRVKQGQLWRNWKTRIWQARRSRARENLNKPRLATRPRPKRVSLNRFRKPNSMPLQPRRGSTRRKKYMTLAKNCMSRELYLVATWIPPMLH